MPSFKSYSGPAPTTAALAALTTNTAIHTLLQIATPSTRAISVLSWGFSFDDPPGADAVCELVTTDVAATVTAHVASGVMPLDPNGAASLMTLSTSGTGYNASAEGTPTSCRVHDVVSLSSASGESPLVYTYQFMPDERPVVGVSKFLRVRVTTPTTGVGARCWVVWDE